MKLPSRKWTPGRHVPRGSRAIDAEFTGTFCAQR
jgi:hypothetical protein